MAAIIFAAAMASCSEEGSNELAINELMPNNRTGLQNKTGKPTDWIEIKNNGSGTVDLKGYKIAVIKETEATEETDGEKEQTEKATKTKEWKFPSTNITGGECLVVFTGKNKDADTNGELQADLKLPKEGATVQLISPSGKIISELKYDKAEPDKAIALRKDGTYQPTYWQSPGRENDRKGYEEATAEIEGRRKGPLKIWELMSRDQHSYGNWVELKNVSDKPVELSTYRIAKMQGKEEGWQLPTKTLGPGEIISVQLAGGKAKQGAGIQAPFKLGDAETIVLTKEGKFEDGLCAKLTPFGGTIGRKEGAPGYYFYNTPTRGTENNQRGYRYIAEKPEWDQKPGIYKDRKEIWLKLKNPEGKKVHYTLDGSEPTLASPLFKDSLQLTKPTVVRSLAEGDDKTMQSNVATASYLIGVDHDLPVINISLNNADMYDHYTGIYADGPGYDEKFPHVKANYWKNWTKKAYVELFDGKDGFASDCGLKIFGAYSRAEPKKSFRLKFRGEFGDAKVDYDFFDTGEPMETEDLVLRSGSQDWARYMIKDEFFTGLVQSGSDPSRLLTQMYRPIALYINAEYFGLYYIREKIDKNFVARKLGLPNDSIIVEVSGGGHYMPVQNRLTSMDMSKPENFEYAKQLIDLESLIDFKIGNIYSGKGDVGNTRYAWSGDPKSDRKWRYVYYDIDVSWKPDGSPSAAFYLSTAPGAIVAEKAKYNALIAGLLKNKEFRQMFLSRLGYHLANTYATKNTTAYFDKFVERIRPEMKQNCKRWPRLSYEKWENNILEFRSRFEGRPQKILNDIRKQLNVTEEENRKYFGSLGY